MIISQDKCIMQMTPHIDKVTDRTTNAKDQDQYLLRQEK